MKFRYCVNSIFLKRPITFSVLLAKNKYKIILIIVMVRGGGGGHDYFWESPRKWPISHIQKLSLALASIINFMKLPVDPKNLKNIIYAAQ